ncbi:MAG TPA: helix-hairpin-helix domain-containing protein, partial [Taishania sp.]|nr:helix-hairpin-helix domain-containing protein [Taishania sp.]
HRFGITRHRNKRSKAAIQSQVLAIDGIGEKTQIALMKKFKTVSRIKAASLEELTEVIGKAKATLVKNALQ